MSVPALDPLIDLHIRTINQSILDIRDTLKAMSTAITTLARVESELKGAKESVSDHEDRILAVEKEIPLLRQTHHWVVTGVLGIIALVGLTFWHFVISPVTTPKAAVAAPAVPR